jgi:Dolichyl-phosphate-mannose-protein mannosyltransferase
LIILPQSEQEMICRLKISEFIKENRWLLSIIGLGLVVNGLLLLLYWFPESKTLIGDEKFFIMRARMFLNLPVEENFWSLHPEYWSKLYAQFIALMGCNIFAIQIVQIISLNILGVSWYLIVKKLTNSKNAALITVALILLSPHLNSYTHYLWAEILHVTLISIAFMLFIIQPFKRYTGLSEVIAGVLIGIALFTKTMLLGFVPVVGLVLLYKRGVFKTTIFAAGVVSVFILSSFGSEKSWKFSFNNLVYSYPLLAGLTSKGEMLESKGKPVILRRGGKAYHIFQDGSDQMYISKEEYHERIRFSTSFREYVLAGDDRFSYVKGKLQRLYDEKGFWGILSGQLKKQYSSLFSFKTMLVHQLNGEKISSYSNNQPFLNFCIKWYSYLFYGVLSLLTIVGIFFQWRKPAFILMLLYFGYYIIMFLVMYTTTRYRIQMEPIFAAFGGIGLVKLTGYLKRFKMKRLESTNKQKSIEF